MKKYSADAEMRRLMKQESAGRQLATFMLATIFGAIAGIMILTLRRLIIDIFGRCIISARLQAAQYGGWIQTSDVAASAALAVLWLAGFMLCWHRIGKCENAKYMLKTSGAWSLSAAVLYAVIGVSGAALTGAWPGI